MPFLDNNNFRFLLTSNITQIMYYNKRVSISVLVIWSCIEPVRLYYGFTGNLKEKVESMKIN